MYLSALAKMDYMEMNEKIAPYPDKDITAKDQQIYFTNPAV
jgi:hypothetical protein